MVLIDPEIANKRVHATLIAAFRYGREDMDVLGLQFRKDLISLNVVVYPPPSPSTTTNQNSTTGDHSAASVNGDDGDASESMFT